MSWPLWSWIADRVDDFYERAHARRRFGERIVADVARAVVLLVRQLYRDECLAAAAALTYTTLLSLAPLLAVSFAVLSAFASSEALIDQVRDWVVQTFLASAVSEVAEVFEDFLARSRSGAVGIVGFAFLMVTSVSLFLSIERTFNRIWRAHRVRPLYRRITTFYAVITLAPALLGLAIYASFVVQAGLERVPFGTMVAAKATPWVLETLALTLLYRLMPHTRVRWRTALFAGLAAAVVFHLTKWGFNNYVVAVYAGSVRAKIYGSFALVPVFFLWVYLSWLIVLGGVELGFIVQNWAIINDERVVRRQRRLGARLAPTGYLAVRVMFEIAQQFRAHGGAVALDFVAKRLEASIDELRPVIDLLQERALILSVEEAPTMADFVPARPLDRITLAEVYRLPGERGYQPGHLPARGAARVVEERLRMALARRDEALDISLAALLAEAEREAGGEAEA